MSPLATHVPVSGSGVPIDDAVRHHAAERGDSVALMTPHHRLTWAELDAAADRCAGYLADHGVGPGDRVAWLGPNEAGYPITLLGAWRRGATIVGLNFRLPAPELRALSAEIGLAHTIVDTRFEALAAHLRSGQLTHVDAREIWPPTDQHSVDTIATDDDAEAMLYFTSGSTGHPKAVPLTRRAVEATIPYASVHEFTPDSRVLIIPPSFHAAGATWTNYGLQIGVTTVYSDDPSPAGIAQAIADNAITHTILVPTLIHSLLDELRRNPRPLESLQHVGYGASPITQHLLNQAIEILGCDFCQVYGLSESGGGVAFLLPADHLGESPAHLASAGRPGMDVDVEVRDPDGRVLGRNESGELWFRAPSLTKGYLGNPEATGRVLVDGWLNSRDVGFLDDDGYIYVLGRSDDMIQTGGENVHPQAVEEVLATLPGVTECAVYGTPDDHWGQRVTAAIVADAVTTLSADDVIAWCSGKLASYQIPKTVIFVDALPRTATGKVKRTELPGVDDDRAAV